jgi:hypothetical protein
MAFLLSVTVGELHNVSQHLQPTVRKNPCIHRFNQNLPWNVILGQQICRRQSRAAEVSAYQS